MLKQLLSKELVSRHLAVSRSQAEDIIRRGFVVVNNTQSLDPNLLVDGNAVIKVLPKAQFVSRAGEKLFSVLDSLGIEFEEQIVLDVGSSTGGFSDVALRAGARKVIAVDIGSQQLHPKLRLEPRLELHEKTDIREFKTNEKIDKVLIDVSFVSLREILPAVSKLVGPQVEIIAMVKPQFEADDRLLSGGVIKNNHLRRDVLKDFEAWIRPHYQILAKADSGVAGAKGNVERFYRLRATSS
ncbi:MAG TPA: TlyA family RNA methyltransferase [Candidatus Binatia bacterium]|nr:TlyA family RNA methyltransferase [Candidatus Binatia bacterium]